LIDEEGEVREIASEDVALFKPFSALPEDEQKVLLKLRKRGPQKTPKKVEALRSWLVEMRKEQGTHSSRNR
jgi:hypothetical protein